MDDMLRKLQLTQLEIMKVVDGFCKKNNIQYSLYSGTLLGAIRHKGFIPWDDDIDICMARDQYNKFIKMWNKQHPEGYILQNKENTPGFTQSFTKIRKEHTTFLQSVDLPELYDVGIFIDIFPADKMPRGKFKLIFFKINCILFQLYTKEYIPKDTNAVEKIITWLALNTIPKRAHESVRRFLFKQVTKYNKDKSLCTFFNDCMYNIKTAYPVNLLDEFVYLDFEDTKFQCMKEWDDYLTLQYGDYMTPPPETDRVSEHNAVIIDFEHGYKEHMKLCAAK